MTPRRLNGMPVSPELRRPRPQPPERIAPLPADRGPRHGWRLMLAVWLLAALAWALVEVTR